MEVQDKQVNIPILSIGMPVYNGGKYISQALKSLQNQSFQNWKLLIADNASTDNTREVVSGFLPDERISYIRHSENMGAISNFEFVLAQVNTEYFMWAAADDEWENEFLDACILPHQKDSSLGLSFCNIVNINEQGKILRKYPDFTKFAIQDSLQASYNYILDTEQLGKANLIYGVYNTKLCKEVIATGVLNSSWGSDMAFVLGIIARSKIHIDQRILFKKRQFPIGIISTTIWSAKEFEGYHNNLLKSIDKTDNQHLLSKIIEIRKQLLFSTFKIAPRHKISALISRKIYKILLKISSF